MSAPVDGTEMMLRIGFHCHRIPCVIAKPDQILAHTRVKRPVGRGAERIGQIEQPGGPIGKIKRAAMQDSPIAVTSESARNRDSTDSYPSMNASSFERKPSSRAVAD